MGLINIKVIAILGKTLDCYKFQNKVNGIIKRNLLCRSCTKSNLFIFLSQKEVNFQLISLKNFAFNILLLNLRS